MVVVVIIVVVVVVVVVIVVILVVVVIVAVIVVVVVMYSPHCRMSQEYRPRNLHHFCSLFSLSFNHLNVPKQNLLALLN